MPELHDISLYRFSQTVSALDQLYDQDPELYEDLVREICADFRLAREYMLAIQQMSEEGADKSTLQQVDLHLKHILATWILAKDVAIPLADGSFMH
jgi:hypothetical protein